MVGKIIYVVSSILFGFMIWYTNNIMDFNIIVAILISAVTTAVFHAVTVITASNFNVIIENDPNLYKLLNKLIEMDKGIGVGFEELSYYFNMGEKISIHVTRLKDTTYINFMWSVDGKHYYPMVKSYVKDGKGKILKSLLKKHTAEKLLKRIDHAELNIVVKD